MVRKLKFHEQKLLKKVDFLQWSHRKDDNIHEVRVIRRYRLPDREVYQAYSRLCGEIRHLAYKISLLNPQDPFRLKKEQQLLEKLYQMGVISAQKTNFSQCEKVTVSAFCRRRLAVVMCRLKMSESIKQATRLLEQGHVRVGPEVVTDPAFLVTRTMEDFITWVDTSKIKQKIMAYNGEVDDFIA